MQLRLNLTQNGQELQIADFNSLAQVASAADDQVIAEIFRLQPGGLGGSPVKYIQHYSYRATGADNATTVVPLGATGAVQINPFRAIVGSRTGIISNATLAWSDIRSQFFIANASNLFQSQTLLANASGNPRWDLVYAAVAIDGQTANVTRYVKSPTTKVVNPVSLSVSLATTVTVGVVTGTPGATPALPALPADTASVFNIALAYVRVPNGFTFTSTVSPKDIRDIAPVIWIDRHTGVSNIRPANGNNDGAATYATNSSFAWVPGSSGTRPSLWIPPAMMGGDTVFVEIDVSGAGSGTWSHTSGAVVDNSVDWRNRFFKVSWYVHASLGFATDPTAGTTRMPYAGSSLQVGAKMGASFLANSFAADAAVVAGGSTIALLSNTQATDIAAGNLGLYVDQSTGALKFYIAGGNPGVKVFFYVEATACFPNA